MGYSIDELFQDVIEKTKKTLTDVDSIEYDDYDLEDFVKNLVEEDYHLEYKINSMLTYLLFRVASSREITLVQLVKDLLVDDYSDEVQDVTVIVKKRNSAEIATFKNNDWNIKIEDIIDTKKEDE